MMTTQKTTIPLFLVLLLIVAPLAITIAFANPITVEVAEEYGTGEALVVSGTATPNAQVSIIVLDSEGGRRGAGQATADAEGNYSAEVLTLPDEPIGTWTVKATDGTTGESAEATFTLISVVDVTPPTLTISITPVKTEYWMETITITVTANENLSVAEITVTQAGATPAAVETTQVTPREWSGTYNVIDEEFKGTATISVRAVDLAGNEATKTKTFEVVPALEERISLLETRVNELETSVADLEATVDENTADIATLQSDVQTLTGISMIAYVAIIIGIIAIVIAIIAIVRKPKPPAKTP